MRIIGHNKKSKMKFWVKIDFDDNVIKIQRYTSDYYYESVYTGKTIRTTRYDWQTKQNVPYEFDEIKQEKRFYAQEGWEKIDNPIMEVELSFNGWGSTGYSNYFTFTADNGETLKFKSNEFANIVKEIFNGDRQIVNGKLLGKVTYKGSGDTLSFVDED
jgi:hypothetical protein